MSAYAPLSSSTKRQVAIGVERTKSMKSNSAADGRNAPSRSARESRRRRRLVVVLPSEPARGGERDPHAPHCRHTT